jgi:hypothetical protein
MTQPAPKASPKPKHGLPDDQLDRLTDLALDVWNRQGDASLTDPVGRPWTFTIQHTPGFGLLIVCQGMIRTVPQMVLGTVGARDAVRSAVEYLDDETPELLPDGAQPKAAAK